PRIVDCGRGAMSPLPGATCSVRMGDASRLVTATILTPDQVLVGGQLLVGADGKIACAACDCSKMAVGATEVSCPSGVVSPGLINAHDHITYAQNLPAPDSGE